MDGPPRWTVARRAWLILRTPSSGRLGRVEHEKRQPAAHRALDRR